MVVVRRVRRKSAFTGSPPAVPPRGSPECGHVGPELVLQLWVLAKCFIAAASSRAVVSCPAANRNVEVRTTEVTSGVCHRDSGQGQVGEHVLSRLTPAVLDVLGKPFVEPCQWVLPGVTALAGTHLADGAAQSETFTEALVVLLGHTEEICDHQHGERLSVRIDELASTVPDELVQLLIGESPDERLVVP